MALLTVENITVRFGAVRALDGLSLSIDKGKLVGLIGPNGAGKTTFIDAVSGFVRCSGSVVFDGQPLDGLRPHQRAWRGLARTFQSMELFGDLTVRQNLEASYENRRHWGLLASNDQGRGETLIQSTLQLLDIEDVADRLPGSLPLGIRKLVGVGRALSSGAQLVLLDEPAAGLDTNESRALAMKLRRVSEQGTSLVLVDHDMDLVFEACQEVRVLNFGKLLAEGSVEEIRANTDVRRAYLGEPVADAQLEGVPS